MKNICFTIGLRRKNIPLSMYNYYCLYRLPLRFSNRKQHVEFTQSPGEEEGGGRKGGEGENVEEQWGESIGGNAALNT